MSEIAVSQPGVHRCCFCGCANKAAFRLVTLGKVPDGQGGLKSHLETLLVCKDCMAGEVEDFANCVDQVNDPVGAEEHEESYKVRDYAIAVVPLVFAGEDFTMLTGELQEPLPEPVDEDEEPEEDDSAVGPVAQIDQSNDDNFPTFWEDEKDWLVDVVMMSPNGEDPEGDRETLAYVGRANAYAMATNTRMLAQVGDRDLPGYELWFSFDSEEHKQQFLELIRQDGYVDPDDGISLTPPSPAALRDITNLRPWGRVFPRDQGDYITTVGVTTMMGLQTTPENADA